jgi:phage shock protein PspC (stress-responsive transcriptional regulator)
MKKTLSVNLGGMVYHIDEDAYAQLMDYLQDLKKHLGPDESSEEVLNDIEQRISELFNEWMQGNREVVTAADVQKVISVLGRPEQINAEETEENTSSDTGKTENDQSRYTKTEYSEGGRRRLYRDTDNGILGGVCSGIAAYLNISMVLVRVIVFLLIWFGGSGLLIYILCWIIIPEARTAAQKLEMKGEDVTIDNIEKKVREEYSKAKDRFGNYVESNDLKNRSRSIGHRLGDFVVICFKVLLGFIAGVIGISGFMVLLALIFALVALWTGMPNNFFNWFDFNFDFPFQFDYYMTNTASLLTLGLILTIGIPFIAIFNLLFGRTLKLKPSPKWLNWVGLILWIAGLCLTIWAGFNFMTSYGLEWM